MAMERLTSKLGRQTYNGAVTLYLWCPGCKDIHGLAVEGKNNCGASWKWNGDIEKPTFSPSLLCRREYGDKREKQVCHSFIRAGEWDFLNDSTHHLAGQKIPIVDFPDGRYFD